MDFGVHHSDYGDALTLGLYNQSANILHRSEVTFLFPSEALRAGILYQKDVMKSFVKDIQVTNCSLFSYLFPHLLFHHKTAESAADHKVLDIWVLFILYSVPAHKRTVENLFRKKVNSILGGCCFCCLLTDKSWCRH